MGEKQNRPPALLFLSYDLLVLDDFGLQPTAPPSAQDLYEIITERYEHSSLIITSNHAFEEWAEIFANDLLASVALDRLTHHAHTLIIRGESFCQRSRRKEIPPIESFSDTPLKQISYSRCAVFGWYTSDGY